MAFFITLEGGEGSGKTTQIRRLKRYLVRRGIPCHVTREPGGCPIGEKVRKILLDPGHHMMTPLSELFLYEAARAQHVKEVIEPLLKRGVTVICDRFADATTAYQGYGRRLNLPWVESLNRLATGGRRPDVTFLLDCPPGKGLKRALGRNRRGNLDKEGRFEEEGLSFHRLVRKGYLAIARRQPQRVRIIDARQGENKVFEKIRQIVDELIEARKPF